MRTRKLFRALFWISTAVFLSMGWGNGCVPDEESFRRPPSLQADAGELKRTFVSSHLEAAISPGKNVLWCATFQLAWNEVGRLVGGDVRFEPPEDPSVAALNRRLVSAEDMDPSSYVALAGRVRDGIYQRIDQALAEKFHGAATPTIKPTPGFLDRPQDIVAYCYLFKKLDFPVPFERLDEPLLFDGARIAAFGMALGKPHHEQMAQDVSILDYRSDDDFVIELKTKSAADHLVLAKVAPGQTLADTIAQVRDRSRAGVAIPAEPSDILIVPKMNFDITRTYYELIGRWLLKTPSQPSDDLMLRDAKQRIRFLMDEKGVQLVSESDMSIGCSAPDRPLPEHRLVFDKPFLLMLIRDGAKEPYFAIWVDNPELLEKAE